MSGKEIRSWTGEAIKGNIGFLLTVSIICNLPSLLWYLLADYRSRAGLPYLWEWAVALLGAYLKLGGICVVLKLIQEEKQDFAALTIPLSPNYVSKSLTVVVILSVLTGIGKSLFHLGILSIFNAQLIGLPDALLQVSIATVLFPISYLLFFYPDWPVGKVVREGFRAGCVYFGDILGFILTLSLPALVIVFFMALSCVFVSVLTIFVMIFGVIGLVLYTSYMTLARGKYAIERFSK